MTAPADAPRVRVNQHGYLPDGPRRATLVSSFAAPVAWTVRDATGSVLAVGVSEPLGPDAASGLDLHRIDLRAGEVVPGAVVAGDGLTLTADGSTSHPFPVTPGLYDRLPDEALTLFRLLRSGVEIGPEVAGPAYARAAGHIGVAPNLGDTDVPCLEPRDYYDGWTADYRLDVRGGWYDAGDHGKYVVNGGIAVAQLLGAHERAVRAGAPDDGVVGALLAEARWELEWMLRMRVPAGEPLAGMVHHKVHDAAWTGLPTLPAEDPQTRVLHRPSTAATLNLAAVAAQGARLLRAHDAAFADTLLDAALDAWCAAADHPGLLAPAAAGADGGGPYDDADVSDERYWAAAELFCTTGVEEFGAAVLASPHHTGEVFGPWGFDWQRTAGLGRLTLATVPHGLPGVDAVRASVVAAAERYLAAQAREGFATTYAPPDGVYAWGSNAMVLNTAVVVATAFDLTGERRFRDGVLEAMDHLLGRNALDQSYVTGYGARFSHRQHSRWFAQQLDPALPPPPRGTLAGGPNSDRGTWDPVIAALDPEGALPAQRCYVDDIHSWSTNELTINWNSALVWIATFLTTPE